ncbi:hypothetical protein [Streptomyces chryseus]
MNLHPGGSGPLTSDAATTVTMPPTSVVTLAPAPVPEPRLDAALFTDPEAVRLMVAHWTREQLYGLGRTLMEAGDRRADGQLVDVLRALFAPQLSDTDAPLVAVEFITDTNTGNLGPVWDDATVWLRYADGTECRFEFTADDEGEDDPEYVALDEGFRDLLALRSEADRPQSGERLIVTLPVGDFNVLGTYNQS